MYCMQVRRALCGYVSLMLCCERSDVLRHSRMCLILKFLNSFDDTLYKYRKCGLTRRQVVSMAVQVLAQELDKVDGLQVKDQLVTSGHVTGVLPTITIPDVESRYSRD